MPTPVRADTQTAPGRACRSERTSSSLMASTLLTTISSGTAAASISPSTTRTASIWPSGSGSEPSTTCTSRSAAATSSSVERNASTSWCGRCRTKPTVSVSVYSRPSGRLGPADRRVEGREQRVLDEHARAGQRVEQAGLAGVRVARDGHAGHGVAVAARPLGRPGRRHAGDLAAQLAHPRADAPAVGLDLRLTRAAGTDAATTGDAATGLPGQRLTPAAQPRQHVLHLGELDLGLALPAAGVLGEDVEDQRGPVDDLDLQHLLQLVELTRGQLAVADHGVGAGRRDDVADLVRLARTHVGGGVGLVAPLADRLEHLGARGLGECGELGERAVGVGLGALGPHARPARRARGAAAGTRPR